MSDIGKQFVDTALSSVCEYFGIDRIPISPYHPHGNGKLERSHATLTNILAKLTQREGDWVEKLPLVQMAMRMRHWIESIPGCLWKTT